MDIILISLMVIMTIFIIGIMVYILFNMPSRQQVLRLQREINAEKSGREECMEELNRFFILVAKMSLKIDEMENPRPSGGKSDGENAGSVWERITSAYNEAELKQFLADYFHLDINTIIPVGSVKEMSLELVKYFQRRNELHKLIDALKADRGGWEWKM